MKHDNRLVNLNHVLATTVTTTRHPNTNSLITTATVTTPEIEIVTTTATRPLESLWIEIETPEPPTTRTRRRRSLRFQQRAATTRTLDVVHRARAAVVSRHAVVLSAAALRRSELRAARVKIQRPPFNLVQDRGQRVIRVAQVRSLEDIRVAQTRGLEIRIVRARDLETPVVLARSQEFCAVQSKTAEVPVDPSRQIGLRRRHCRYPKLVALKHRSCQLLIVSVSSKPRIARFLEVLHVYNSESYAMEKSTYLQVTTFIILC